MLGYSEGRLSPRKRENLEHHFADCDDCTESLALYVRTMGEQNEPVAALAGGLDDDALVREQSSRILTMIKEDEFRKAIQPATGEPTTKRGILSFRNLALAGTFASAILAVAVIWYVTQDSNSELGMRALARVNAVERRTPVRVSGNFAYSIHRGEIRGPSDDSSSEINYAVDVLRAGEAPSASREQRLAFARALLMRGGPGDNSSARSILEGLVRTTTQSAELAEIHNDLGVASFQSRNYSMAIESFDQALANHAGYDEALFNRALTKERMRDYEGARRDWEAFINSAADEGWKGEARQRLSRLPAAN
jgi:tetratricopeptide (TPR) repeat protein